MNLIKFTIFINKNRNVDVATSFQHLQKLLEDILDRNILMLNKILIELYIYIYKS